MKKIFSTLILVIGLILSANSQDTLRANILRVCEFDTSAKNNLRNCLYYNEKTEFVFSDSTILVAYDSLKSAEYYNINKKKENVGLTEYYCSIGKSYTGGNVILYYYKPIGLVKVYYYNHKERKTFVYSYFKIE